MYNAQITSLHHETKPVNKYQVCADITKLHAQVINRRAKYVVFSCSLGFSFYKKTQASSI